MVLRSRNTASSSCCGWGKYCAPTSADRLQERTERVIDALCRVRTRLQIRVRLRRRWCGLSAVERADLGDHAPVARGQLVLPENRLQLPLVDVPDPRLMG